MDVAVVDCSAVAAWLLREPDGVKLDDVVLAAAEGSVAMVAPALLAFELVNVINVAERRKRITPATAMTVLGEFNRLPIEYDQAPTAPQRGRIHELATQHNLSAYDAAYIELCERLGGSVYTLYKGLLGLSPKYPFIL